MHFIVRAVRIPKAGNQPWEYEDDLRWNRGARGRQAARRYAVADGASESSFAASWASLLTQAYVHGLLSVQTLIDDLVPLQARWWAEVEARPLPWYAAEKARAGACAALTGVTLHPSGLWTALAVGDCCAFQVRAGRLECAFPFDSPDQFSRSPLLISSSAAKNDRLTASLATTWGIWEPDDVFLMMSDALAAYFLREVSTLGRLPFDVLPETDHYSDSYRRIERLRAEGALRNDDVSLLSVRIVDPNAGTYSALSTQDAGLR